MTDGGRTLLTLGSSVMTDNGTALVVRIQSTVVDLRDCVHRIVHVEWDDLRGVRNIQNGGVAALTEPLRPLWDTLDDAAREIALNRLEVVQEILTGYRDGHPELKRPDEPRPPFGEGFGVSESRRASAMAAVLAAEGQSNRRVQRRLRDNEINGVGIDPSTIRNWLRAWHQQGLRGLIDGRTIRKVKTWDAIDQRYRRTAEDVFRTLDGDRSTVSLGEIDRQIRVRLKDNGVVNVRTPQRKTQEFLSTLKREKGATTRSQRSKALQGVSGFQHYPAIRPGQVVAIDATRADNLVFDALSGHACSVEILTAIDVATRVVLAARVVPRSANGIEAGLLLYDVCRPFSLTVQGRSISEWRWVGLPETIDFSAVVVQAGRRLLSPDLSTLQGEHGIPSVTPDAVHCDHGSIFLSDHFLALLHDLKIDLLLTRGEKPTDNPHVERWHETLQRALQQIPGYKGRNVSERGRLVSEEPLLTANELQEHLRRFIALDYHRSWHTGLVLPGEPDARLCPLEMWDAMVEVTGRIDVPQTPDLIFQFLPIRWGTISHDGVEFSDMTFDSPILDPYRTIARGHFRNDDRAAPFYVDPHDLSRIWFRDPATTRVEAIPWRGANRTQAPLTQTIVDAARRIIRNRGGNAVLNRDSATRQILEELTELTRSASAPEWNRKLAAAARRVEQSRADLAEAQRAQTKATSVRPISSGRPHDRGLREAWPNLLEND